MDYANVTYRNACGDVLDIQVFGVLEKDGHQYLLVGERTAGSLSAYGGAVLSEGGELSAGFMRVISDPQQTDVILDGIPDAALCRELQTLWTTGGKIEIVEGEWTFPDGVIIEFSDETDRRFVLNVIGYTAIAGITYAMISGKDLHRMFEDLDGVVAIAVQVDSNGNMVLIEDDDLYEQLLVMWRRDTSGGMLS